MTIYWLLVTFLNPELSDTYAASRAYVVAPYLHASFRQRMTMLCNLSHLMGTYINGRMKGPYAII